MEEFKSAEIAYKVVNSVRFEEGLPSDRIERISKFFGSHEENFRKEDSGFQDDIRCYLEHELLSGSSPILREPLKPFGLLSGRKTISDLINERKNDEINTKFIYPVEKLFRDKSTTNKNSQEIEISDSNIKHFREFIEKNESSELDADLIFGKYEKMNIDESTGILQLPYLKSILLNKSIIDLPEELRGKIRLRKYLAKRRSNSFGVDMSIDQGGWIIRKVGE